MILLEWCRDHHFTLAQMTMSNLPQTTNHFRGGAGQILRGKQVKEEPRGKTPPRPSGIGHTTHSTWQQRPHRLACNRSPLGIGITPSYYRSPEPRSLIMVVQYHVTILPGNLNPSVPIGECKPLSCVVRVEIDISTCDLLSESCCRILVFKLLLGKRRLRRR